MSRIHRIGKDQSVTGFQSADFIHQSNKHTNCTTKKTRGFSQILRKTGDLTVGLKRSYVPVPLSHPSASVNVKDGNTANLRLVGPWPARTVTECENMSIARRNTYCGSPAHPVSRRGFLRTAAAGTAAVAADMTVLDSLKNGALAAELAGAQRAVERLLIRATAKNAATGRCATLPEFHVHAARGKTLSTAKRRRAPREAIGDIRGGVAAKMPAVPCGISISSIAVLRRRITKTVALGNGAKPTALGPTGVRAARGNTTAPSSNMRRNKTRRANHE